MLWQITPLASADKADNHADFTNYYHHYPGGLERKNPRSAKVEIERIQNKLSENSAMAEKK